MKPTSNTNSHTTSAVLGHEMNDATVALQSSSTFSEIEIPGYFENKKLLMRGLGLVLLLMFFPIILLIMLVTRLSSPGPAIYRQKRMGLGCRVFTIYKIRTMRQDAEKSSGPVWCQQSDSRITSMGRLLRFLHLDELPQLLNVVRGEMDLIGPRPERPEFIDELVEKVSGYAERMNVLPGVTGLAQINLPPDETIECVRRKVTLDMQYIQTASWGLDFRILLCTAFRMIGIRNGVAVNLLKLDRGVSQLENMTRNPSTLDALKQNIEISDDLHALKPFETVTGDIYQVGRYGSSQIVSSEHLNGETRPEDPPISVSSHAETESISTLPKNPK